MYVHLHAFKDLFSSDIRMLLNVILTLAALIPVSFEQCRCGNCVNGSKVCMYTGSARETPHDMVCIKANLSTLGNPDPTAFQMKPNLTSVMMSGVILYKLHNDTFYGSTNLEFICIHDTMLTALPSGIFQGLYNVKHIVLKQNQLGSLPADIFHGLIILECLDLSSNKLYVVRDTMLSGLASLKRLSLSKNNISHLPDVFKGTPDLEALYLSENKLTLISHQIIRNLMNLKILDLSSNLIEHLPSTLYEDLSSIRSLNLHDNQLRTMPVLPDLTSSCTRDGTEATPGTHSHTLSITFSPV